MNIEDDSRDDVYHNECPYQTRTPLSIGDNGGDNDKSHVSPGGISSAWKEEEDVFTIERLHYTRKQLDEEIKMMETELTSIGQESDLMADSDHIIQEQEFSTLQRNVRIGRKKFNRDPKDIMKRGEPVEIREQAREWVSKKVWSLKLPTWLCLAPSRSKPSYFLKGVKFLVEKHVINSTFEDIALFLHVGEFLDKSAVGDFLGEGKDYYVSVLNNFVELHNFTGMNLVEALRYFLKGFRLPGEAQKIDRMMELFAMRYCFCNEGTFSNPDSCYVLSFSIIMLNTSLHNPNVKDKPSLEQFIYMNRGINDGEDFPSDMLKNLYECIKVQPFKIHDGDDDLTQVFFNPDYEGYLIKEGGKHRSWCKRWFILSDNCLYYFKSPEDKEPRGIIPLENLIVKECHDIKKPWCFEIISVPVKQYTSKGTIKACKTTGQGKVVTGNHQVYRIQASSKSEMDEWIRRINASIASNPFIEILQERRQRVSNRGPIII